MTKIDKLKELIEEYAKMINAPEKLWPAFERNDYANPFIEIDNNGHYNYVVRERGVEHERKVFENMDGLLFQVFKDITFLMATDYELHNRVENQDSRILLFSKKEELLAMLNEEWAEREHLRHQKLLKN